MPFGRRRWNDAAARGDSLKGRRRAPPRAGSRAGEALVSPDRRNPDGRAVRRGGGFARHRDTAAPGRSVKIRSARVLRCTRPSDRRGPRSGPPYAFDASMICSINNAFYTVTRSSLRSSSIREPSDPPFGVIFSPIFQGFLAMLRRSEAHRRAESPEAGGKARFRRRETRIVHREPLCRAPHGPTSPPRRRGATLRTGRSPRRAWRPRRGRGALAASALAPTRFYRAVATLALPDLARPRSLAERGLPGQGRQGGSSRRPPGAPALTRRGDRPVSRGTARGRIDLGRVSTMILPQVHLRKPCYDFYFL